MFSFESAVTLSTQPKYWPRQSKSTKERVLDAKITRPLVAAPNQHPSVLERGGLPSLCVGRAWAKVEHGPGRGRKTPEGWSQYKALARLPNAA